MWIIATAVLRGTFIALTACIRKEEISLINYISLNLKNLKKRQSNPKARRKRLSNKKQKLIRKKNKWRKIYETMSLFFGKINKVDKYLVRLTNKEREKIHIINSGNEAGDIIVILVIKN